MTGLEIDVKRSRHGKFLLSSLALIIPGLPSAFDGYRIVQLTDLHYGPCTSARHLRRAVNEVSHLNPHLVLLTGDYLQAGPIGGSRALASRIGVRAASWIKYRRNVRRLAVQLNEILTVLNPQDGMIGVFGNHDYSEGIGSIIRKLGTRITWLVNDAVLVGQGDNNLLIAGTDDHRRGRLDLKKTVAKAATLEAALPHPPITRILLSHNPDITLRPESALITNFDLLLCGHTHGGQICLPLIGPVATRTKQKAHATGLSRLGNAFVYINQGIGYGLIPLRTMCPPEIALITLRAG